MRLWKKILLKILSMIIMLRAADKIMIRKVKPATVFDWLLGIYCSRSLLDIFWANDAKNTARIHTMQSDVIS